MRIPCSPSQFYDACVCIGLDVVDDVVYIPTDMADELFLRVEDVSDGVEIHFTPNMFIINVYHYFRNFYHYCPPKVIRNTMHARKLLHLAGKNEKAASFGGLTYHVYRDIAFNSLRALNVYASTS